MRGFGKCVNGSGEKQREKESQRARDRERERERERESQRERERGQGRRTKTERPAGDRRNQPRRRGKVSKRSRGEPGWCLDRGVCRGVCKTRGVRFPALAVFVGTEPLHVPMSWRLKSDPGTSLPHPGAFCHELWVGAAGARFSHVCCGAFQPAEARVWSMHVAVYSGFVLAAQVRSCDCVVCGSVLLCLLRGSGPRPPTTYHKTRRDEAGWCPDQISTAGASQHTGVQSPEKLPEQGIEPLVFYARRG